MNWILIWKIVFIFVVAMFAGVSTTAAQDDHIPFKDAGIPVIDLIDLSYAYWHTPEDTIDKLSAENIEKVALVK